MPTIICDYCQYVGSGDDYPERIADVEDHEETCPEKPEEDSLQNWKFNFQKRKEKKENG